jgi:hypothetical protein
MRQFWRWVALIAGTIAIIELLAQHPGTSSKPDKPGEINAKLP